MRGGGTTTCLPLACYPVPGHGAPKPQHLGGAIKRWLVHHTAGRKPQSEQSVACCSRLFSGWPGSSSSRTIGRQGNAASGLGCWAREADRHAAHLQAVRQTAFFSPLRSRAGRSEGCMVPCMRSPFPSSVAYAPVFPSGSPPTGHQAVPSKTT